MTPILVENLAKFANLIFELPRNLTCCRSSLLVLGYDELSFEQILLLSQCTILLAQDALGLNNVVKSHRVALFATKTLLEISSPC